MFPIILNDFVAIDFETARDRMPCQVGIAVVKGGKVTENLSFLIQPPSNEYDPYAITVHGITPEITANAPTFPEVWEQIKPYFEGNIIVAHNMSFDYSVLSSSLEYYNISMPRLSGVVDSMAFCEKQSLDETCWRYDINMESHHDGACDARCCAELLLAIMSEKPMAHFGAYPNKGKRRKVTNRNYQDYEVHKSIDKSTKKQDLTGANPDNPFYNKKVVITGVFTQDRNELAHIIQGMGAKINTGISSQTNFVIIGEEPGPSKMGKLKTLKEDGCDIKEIYQEELDRILEEFCQQS